MKFETTFIKGLVVIEPRIIEDERGYFFESHNAQKFKENGVNLDFVQDNQSLSQKNVLRGLHFQNPPFQQGKLVRVIKGAVIDVAVDIRKNSKTYGQHFSIELTEQNKKIFWIPPGFAHGFVSVEEDTIFHYKCTGLYNKASEDSLIWNDPDLDIDWGVTNPIVSEKDQKSNFFKNFNSQF